MQTEAVVPTQAGALYLKKLCRHFAHKIPATISHGQGMLEFPFGRCRLEASDDHLRLAITLPNAADSDKAEQVLGEHLQRMASKESLEIQWTRTAD